jgi:DNA-3-methyladenine glycosylase
MTRLRLPRPLELEFFRRDPRTIARELLGRLLISRLGGTLTSGVIVETESYLARRDAACHAARGRTRRNDAMFAAGGHAYVYPIHAKYCFNVVTEEEDRPSAVLIRAIEPVHGQWAMRRRRNGSATIDLARGPGRLCQALGIDRRQNGSPLCRSSGLWIGDPPWERLDRNSVRRTVRIGVTAAHGLPLRFVVAGSPFASGPKSLR